MKTVILVCALAATALAAPYKRTTRLDPKVSEHVRIAEQAWDAAEREPDPAKQPGLWEQAADAFGDIDGDPVDGKAKREAAYAALLAWKNALNLDPRTKASSGVLPTGKPRQIPVRELKLLGAIERYAGYADPKDPELPGLWFIKAMTHSRFDQTEAAISIFRSVIDRFPQNEVAGYAAQLVLDSYNRLGQYDQLVTFADALAKNTTLLKKSPGLAALVARIQQQAGRKRLELLEAAARKENSSEKYAAAGAGYLELYNANPRERDGDELLYNAGVALESGLSFDAAIQAYTLLQKTYPNSKLNPRLTARLGQIYARTARYDKAAEQLERYAMRYSGEKDAFEAMSDAVYYRRALGDRDKAIANTNFLIKNYGAKQPREAADAMWSLTALYETADPDRAITHLRGYLRVYGPKGPPERFTIAYAKIGQLLWKSSCAVPGVEGVCVKPTERAKVTCGVGTTGPFAVVARDARKAKLALASFADAITEYERRPLDDPSARYFYAQAKLVLADAELEPYLALVIPRDLDFEGGGRTASVKRFGEWMAQKQKAGGAVTRHYEAVLLTKDIASTVTALARLGMLSQSFTSSLLTSELPRGVRSGAKQAYCDAMTDAVAPLETAAVNAFAGCLAKSTELAWFSGSSRYCERELLRLRPADFPAATELRGKPTMVAPVIDTEPAP